MADHSLIEWTDTTWQIVTGCSVVSPGCTNCYAMRLAGTRLKHHPSRAGLTVDSKAGPVWNGQVRFNAEWLTQPLRWTKPRRIFVAAHGDLFHDGVTDDHLDQIFAVMALCPQHTFQILTKRPERMRAYLTDSASQARFERRKRLIWDKAYGIGGETRAEAAIRARGNTAEGMWPLTNVWLGVSVEDQTRADERIPVLLDTPAAVRWISAEPLLGPVNLTRIGRRMEFGKEIALDALRGERLTGMRMLADGAHREPWTHRIDWGVFGGESGPNARPMHPDWVRAGRDQFAAAGVPFLFKQWGAWAAVGQELAEPGLTRTGRTVWPYPDNPERGQGTPMGLIGKKIAGRLLDGVLHDGFPGARS